MRALPGAVALVSLGLGLWLAAHHPLSPALIVMFGLAGSACAAAWPDRSLLIILPTLPLCGLMPWTGWIVVEELDLVVLFVAAGALGRLAVRPPAAPGPRPPGSRHMAVAWLLLGLYTAGTLFALQRGVDDAGGWQWNWWQGYRDPLNALRLAKPVWLVLLVLPLWQWSWRRDADQAARSLRTGMTLALLTTSLGVLWERLAFTGLLNFSSDYRATGLFWEMHVGGAALDAVLAMTLPFAASHLAAQRKPVGMAVAAVCLGLGVYAALVSFSRIVYAAVPVGIGMAWALHTWASPVRPSWRTLLYGLCILIGALACGAAAFALAGYRAMLALVASVILVLGAPSALARLSKLQRGAALLAGLLGAAVPALPGLLGSKGAYVGFGLTWTIAMAAWLVLHAANTRWAAGVYLAGLVASWCGIPVVGWAWAGGIAFDGLVWVAVAGVALVTLLSVGLLAPWPERWQWQAGLATLIVCTMAAVPALWGGAYMLERMQGTTQDSLDRRSHWRQSLSMLRTDEQWWLGLGLGRYPAQQALSGVREFQTGDYRLLDGPEGPRLRLTSGGHVQGWGEIFRVSQRVPTPPAGALFVELNVRADRAAAVHVEVCEKHLLYNGNCLIGEQALTARGDTWQGVRIELKGNSALTRGAWYAPRLAVFSIGLVSNAASVDVREIRLVGAEDRNLLANGSFEQGLARWFFSSDRHHMPWHAKNVAVHVWFEQGVIGLAFLATLAAVALAHCVAGRARALPLAAESTAALVAVAMVGAVDSLLDMPRVAFVVLLLLGVMLSLGPPGRSPTRRAP